MMVATSVAPSMLFNRFSRHSATAQSVSTQKAKQSKSLTLSEPISKHTVTFDSQQQSEILVGRADKVANYQPTLDLACVGAYRLGVSRLHASIVVEQETVTIVDLQSANGTFINNERLTPLEPYPLHKGGVLRLGNLIIDVVLA